MKIRIQVVIDAEDGEAEKIEDVARLERSPLRPEELGLTLAEARSLLRGMQQTIVTAQVGEYLARFASCPHCGRPRTHKGKHAIIYRTVFGKLNLASPRLYDCPCQKPGRHSSSPLAELLSTHTAPELLYLETRFASLMSYGLSVEVLSEVLPIADEITPATVRRQLHAVAERIESELGDEQFTFIEGCPNEWAEQPPPGPPLTVGLDGGYVHASDQKSRTEGWFEVIAGESVKPVRREAQAQVVRGAEITGPANESEVVFMSDGGDTVRDPQTYLSPESEHLLDWFHITMRLTVMRQMVKGMVAEPGPSDGDPATATLLADLKMHLESIKWNLWHGNVPHALQRIDEVDDGLEMLEENPANKPKMLKAVREFRGYIVANQAFIPNYGDRYRHDETISTAFVESTVNYVVSKRFVKKQQMRWTQRGAHLLLQARAQVLNDDLRNTFGRWFPGMRAEAQAHWKEAA